MSVVTALFVVVLIYVLYRYKTYIRKFKDIEKIPGPTIWDIIRFYRQKKSNGLIAFFQSLNKKYGSVAKVWIKPLDPVIVSTDMELVEKIFKSEGPFYAPAFAESEPLFRNGMGTTQVYETWKDAKTTVNKVMTNTYISDRMKGYTKKYDKLMRIIDANLGKAIDIEQILHRTFSEIIVESSNDPQIETTDEEVDRYLQTRKKFMDILAEKMNAPILVRVFYRFTKNYRTFLGLAKEMIGIVEEFLRRHENIPLDQRNKSNLFYAMMDNGMPRDTIVDNINSVIGGGFETSVLPSAVILHELGRQPELQQRALEEVLSVVGPPDSSKQITLYDTQEMTFLHHTIKESLRLYFPTPFLDRILTQDVKVKNLIIPKGTRVIFNVPQIQTSEENYESSSVFNPDRFHPDIIDEKGKKAFLAFGYGIKTCPGKYLAIAVMKLLVAKIITEYEICPIEYEHKVQLKADLLFRTVDGVPLVFKKRVYSS